MKAYVLEQNWAEENEQFSNLTVFLNYKNAKARFDKLVKEDKEEIYKSVYNIENSDYEWEEKEDEWSIWESGYYVGNHSDIRIVECEIEDEK